MLKGKIFGPTKAIIIIRAIAVLGTLLSLLAFSMLLNPILDPYENVPEYRQMIAQKQFYRQLSLLLLGPVSLPFHLCLFALQKWAFLLSIPFYVLMTWAGGGPFAAIFVALLVYCFFITDLRE